MASISIIIPLGPDEPLPLSLIASVSALPDAEILIASGERGEVSLPNVLTISSQWGRAIQQNTAANSASADWLWFLHADSLVTPEALNCVSNILDSSKRNFYYFRLGFDNDGPKTVHINEWGANLRSRWLGLPFGDQGFLLSKPLWRGLGKFRQDVTYGEDHLLIWAAKRAGVPLVPLPAKLTTSARKYRSHGWLPTTRWSVSATYRQAFGEAKEYLALKNPARDTRAALAIFVKTPKFSPIKTRLAESTSPDFASRFYELAILAANELATAAKHSGHFFPYWCVAEKEALNDLHWKSFPAIAQGEGGLGDRLHTIYHFLLKRHSKVFLIGCDCPHLSMREMASALDSLRENSFVAGPARDGGFYLFGGKTPIERGAWNSVPYSSEETLSQLRACLTPLGDWGTLAPKTDVDTARDLISLKNELADAELSQSKALKQMEKELLQQQAPLESGFELSKEGAQLSNP